MAETYNQFLTLSLLRREIVRITGRYDLVTITDEDYYCNNGIDLYIHQGQRALERRLNVFPTYAKWWYTLGQGDYWCEIENLRAVQECFVLDGDTLNQKMIRIDEKFFEEETKLPSFYDESGFGQPLYYWPCKFKTGWPISDTKLLNDYDASQVKDVRLELEYGGIDPKLKGVVVYPPASQDYTIEIRGLYYDSFPQDECTGEGGGEGGGELGLTERRTVSRRSSERRGAYVQYSNYWMQEYPNLLIMASIQQLDYMFRGKSAALKWEELISNELVHIEKDAIEEDIAHVSKMEG